METIQFFVISHKLQRRMWHLFSFCHFVVSVYTVTFLCQLSLELSRCILSKQLTFGLSSWQSLCVCVCWFCLFASNCRVNEALTKLCRSQRRLAPSSCFASSSCCLRSLSCLLSALQSSSSLQSDCKLQEH